MCSALKVAAALLFFLDWILVSYNTSKNEEAAGHSPSSRRRRRVCSLASRVRGVCSQQRASLISLDKVPHVDHHDNTNGRQADLLEPGLDSDYNSAADVEVEVTAFGPESLLTPNAHLESLIDYEPRRRTQSRGSDQDC